MAVFVDVTDRVDFRMFGSVNDQTTISTFSLTAFNGTGPIDFNEVVSDLEALMSAGGDIFPLFRACCPTNWTFNFTQWQAAKSNARFLNKKVSHLQAGTFADVADTSQLAGVIVRRGDLAARTNVSTLHVPIGTGAASLTDGYLDAGLITPLTALAAKLLGTWSSTGGGNNLEFKMCIPNGPFSGQVTPITYTEVKDTCRVMRRRTVGYGI